MTKKSFKKKIIIYSLCLIFAVIAVFAIIFIIKMNTVAGDNDVPKDFASYSLAPDPMADPMSTSVIDTFGYLNYTLGKTENYYFEQIGKVDTIVNQDVQSFRQFKDGVMISTNITKSSMVNFADQTCFASDKVVILDATSKSSNDWNGLETKWNEGSPTVLSLENYVQSKGLPATEISPYFITSETLIDGNVLDNGDGTYSLTMNLKTGVSDAPRYYVNQIKNSGGLNKLPEFSNIKVKFTYTGDWKVRAIDIEEQYTATLGIDADCTATYHGEYFYNDSLSDQSKFALSNNTDRFENVYKKYLSLDPTGANTQKGIDSIACLSGAFANVLMGETVFDVDLEYGDVKLPIIVSTNIPNKLSISAKIDNISVWFKKDAGLFADINGAKVKLSNEEISQLLGGLFADENGSSAIELSNLDVTAVLGKLTSGEFTVTENKAHMSTNLNLAELGLPLDLSIKLDFDFTLNNNLPSLNYVEAVINIPSLEKPIKAVLKFADEKVEKPEKIENLNTNEFVSLMPYIDTIIDKIKNSNKLVVSGGLILNIGETSLALNIDTLELSIKNGLELKIDGSVTIKENNINFALCVVGQKIYLSVQDINAQIDLGNKEQLEKTKNKVLELYTKVCNILDNVLENNPLPKLDDADELLEKGQNALTQVTNKFSGLDKILSFVKENVKLSVNDDNINIEVKDIIKDSKITLGLTKDLKLSLNLELANSKLLTSDLQLTSSEDNLVIPNVSNYINLNETIDNLLNYVDTLNVLLEDPASLVVSGGLTLKIGETSLALNIDALELAIENSLKLKVKGSIIALGKEIGFDLCLVERKIYISVLGVNTTINLDELGQISSLKDTLFTAYKNLYNTVGSFIKNGENPLPSIDGLEGVIDKFATPLSNISINNIEFDLVKFIKESITITDSKITVNLANIIPNCALYFELSNGEKGLKLGVNGSVNGISLIGGVDLTTSKEKIDLSFLEKQTYLDLVDTASTMTNFLNSAINNLTSKNFGVELGEILLDDGTKILGQIELSYEGNSPFVLDIGNKKLEVNNTLIVHTYVEATNTPNNQDVYLDLYLQDRALNKEGSKDGELDCYVIVSRFKATDERYKPIKLYCPLNELDTILSQAFSILNIDLDILNDYFVNNTLSSEEIARLKTVGKKINATINTFENIDISSILGGFGGLIDELNLNSLFDKLVVEENLLDTTLKLGNTSLGIKVIKNDEIVTSTDFIINNEQTISLSYSNQAISMPTEYEGYMNATGVASLIKSFVQSATYEDKNSELGYSVGSDFYISGGLGVSFSLFGLDLIKTKIDVAVDVVILEDGGIDVNMHLSYKKLSVGLILKTYIINEDGEVDITIKNNVVYIKRVSPSGTKYRVMTMKDFTENILDNLAFICNFGDVVKSALNIETEPTITTGDYGQSMANIISKYTFNSNAIGDDNDETFPWVINLNGEALTKVMKDLSVSLDTNELGDVNTITANGSILSVIVVSADLKLQNPQGNTLSSKATSYKAMDESIDKQQDAVTYAELEKTGMIEFK